MAHDGLTEGQYWVGPDGAWDESGASDLGLGMAELTTADLLDPAATSAAFTITSDEAHPFAERIGAETVAPVGDMQNFRVTGVERLGTHAVRVSVEGELVDRGELQGSGIYFDKGSFADAEAVGVAGVSVRYAEATLLPEESAYDEQGGTFRLAVDAGSAQLLAGASASVPSDPAIEVQGVEAAGEHKAVVTVRVPGATAYDQLAALSQALHEGGLTVSGTNAGDVVAFLDAEGYDSVLEYLSPSAYFYVERGAGGKGWTLDADGGATVSLRLRMVAESGDFDLTYAEAWCPRAWRTRAGSSSTPTPTSSWPSASAPTSSPRSWPPTATTTRPSSLTPTPTRWARRSPRACSCWAAPPTSGASRSPRASPSR